jgi:hypothetical protein
MEILSFVTLDEVVAVWLGAEIHRGRFGATVCRLLRPGGHLAALMTNPHLTDGQVGASRLALLRSPCGWPVGVSSRSSRK